MDNRPTVLFIGVCYKTPHLASRFAMEVLESTRSLPVHILVLDNSDDDSHETIRNFESNARASWLRAPCNLGYFGGAQYALQHFLRAHELPNWVVISNVDLSMDAVQFLRVLEQYTGRPDVGVVAPAIVSQSTNHQLNPFMIHRPSALRMHFYKWAFAWAWTLKAYVSASAWWHEVIASASVASRHPLRQKVYAVHGCFMALSSAYFRAGGTLSHGTFLYGEEISVAEFCRENSLQVLLDRGAVVEHLDSMSTSRRIDSKVAKWIAEGARFSADRYFPLMSHARHDDNKS